MRFEFGKGLFNGIEVRTVRWQETKANPARRKQLAGGLNFVRGEIVQDERVAFAQLGAKHLLKIGGKDFGIYGSFHEKGRGEAFVTQSGDEGGTLPVPMRDGAQATLTRRATAIQAGQFGVQTRFINKHQPTDIPARLLLAPKLPRRFHIRPILLGGAIRFFYSSGPVAPADATRRSCQWSHLIDPSTVFAVRPR
jgi:hypothetical protein